MIAIFFLFYLFELFLYRFSQIFSIHRLFSIFFRHLSPFTVCFHLFFISFSLKFRKWFKYGLKAQKLLAQGIALGIIAINKAPCKGKSFVNCLILLKLLPLQGDKLASMITQGAALG